MSLAINKQHTTQPPAAPAQQSATQQLPPSAAATIDAPRDDGAALAESSDERFTTLAQDKDRWHEAMRVALGESYDADTVGAFRQRAARGDLSWLPELQRADGQALDAKLLDAYLDPNADARLELYRSQPPADVSAPPAGLEAFAYGSGDVPLIRSDEQPAYVQGAVGTPPEVAQLAKAGVANFASAAWLEQVAAAVERNGGLGDGENGFLAYSANHGFVRLRNTGLSPEQNRQLAAMSLQMGWPVESLPSRTDDNGLADPEVSRWAGEFIGQYTEQFQRFVADPRGSPIKLRSGKRRYVFEFNEKAGAFVSYNYKKSGGLRGWVQSNLASISKVLGPIAQYGWVVPGVGWIASAAATTVQTAASWIATGKLKAQQLVGAVGSWFMGPGASAATKGVLASANAAAGVIDSGKLDASALVGAVSPWIGSTGDAVLDHAVRQGLSLTASVVDGRKLSARQLYSALAPLVFELPNGPARRQLESLARQIDGGEVSAADAASRIRPLLDGVTGDARLDAVLRDSLELVAIGIDTRKVGAQALLSMADRYLGGALSKAPGRESLYDLAQLAAHWTDTGSIERESAGELVFDLTGATLEEWGERLWGRDEPATEAA